MPEFSKQIQIHQDSKEEEFYTEGSADLRLARIEIAKYSIPLASLRVETQRRDRLALNRQKDEEEYEKYISDFPQYEKVATQYADERAVSRGAMNQAGNLFATSGWSGGC